MTKFFVALHNDSVAWQSAYVTRQMFLLQTPSHRTAKPIIQL